MEMDARMLREPTVALRSVSAEVVEDHVDLPARIRGHHAIHEVQKLDPAAPVMVAGYPAGGGASS